VTTQPEALRLADDLDRTLCVKHGLRDRNAADELRRLYVEVETLKLENNNLRWISMRMTPDKTVAELFYAREENKRLREVNAELLEALEDLLQEYDVQMSAYQEMDVQRRARAAIARAEEVKP
jgi:CRISPR/Cas system CSM-associated protein Csm2 small subunit